ncbi:hypothetical protein [Pseudomonas sp. St316]|uniref:hypothetical protein n=1 Tax=Pseudomonas sp. St316 TaxID=2678257 RepID=UPI001BB38777|nr:hypothetical protein [Pseudomonas sp. St316]BBP58799.1 hypothetical protein PHLH4_23890 [Pseudomonas sp. St316]
MFNSVIVSEIPFYTSVQDARKANSVNLNHLKESLAYGLGFKTLAAHAAHFDALSKGEHGIAKVALFSKSRTMSRLMELGYTKDKCDVMAEVVESSYQEALSEQFFFVPFKPDNGPYDPFRADAFDRTRVWLHGGSRDDICNKDYLEALSDESMSNAAIEWLHSKISSFAFPAILDRRNYQGGIIVRLRDLNIESYPLAGWSKLSRADILEYGSSADTFLCAPMK